LLRAFANCVEHDRPAVLVMTSGNVSDEPIAYRDEEAEERLSGIADSWLTHNREIHIRCDDSIVRVVDGRPQFFRRSRGYVPEPLKMARPFPVPLLACGAHLKNTFCLGKERQAFVSHHIGDLENVETLLSFREGIAHFQKLFDIVPQAVAYDLHPDYLATKYALDLEVANKIGVQHHHAHIASVLAEHGLSGPVIGVAADGTGYGLDGAIWGGEVLVADCHGFERMAHLAYVPLPGGEQAVRQPWRVAAAYLQQCFGDDFLTLDLPFVRQKALQKWRPLAQMIQRGVNSPLTSSLGRLFDAVAALIGIRQEVAYEGQAAIELETAAEPTEITYPFAIQTSHYLKPTNQYNNQLTHRLPRLLDVRPTIQAIVEDIQHGVSTPLIAGRFQRTVADLLAAACSEVRLESGLDVVALSGGVFQNRLLLEQLIAKLEADNFQVYTNQRVPPNDGGLSLGQAAVAAAQLEQGVEVRDWRLEIMGKRLAVSGKH
jgi:hydrogenase maturation protein HypF